MQKMRTRKGIANRFRVTKGGTIVRMRAFRSHLKVHKSGRRIRSYRHTTAVARADVNEVRRSIPGL